MPEEKYFLTSYSIIAKKLATENVQPQWNG